ncbi:hypothetical protein AS9A_3937 [Hoyosella subflava DQS3-9A1]|uniref:Uncharacterized protein n=1 Tax=Hoyosella subflava (strain DSM 45089 / JCM 17490 / NBRC 109087 / DQS3-9A1) TaxID=443218 RepID=F6EHK9_HOYSD|nr:hypothetical protein AS9A_3937 [Hoyosella subflava DQS3-9A1]
MGFEIWATMPWDEDQLHWYFFVPLRITVWYVTVPLGK